MPYSVKAKVLNAALLSSILYSCESWLTDQLSPINKHYMSAVKLLLGVRITTPNILCLVEAGMPELSATVLKRQGNFMRKFLQHSSGEEPLAHALHLCADTSMGRRLRRAAEYLGDAETNSRVSLRTQCRTRAANGSSRFVTYLQMNSELNVHNMYNERCAYIPDSLRIAATRLRLSSHRLRIETGRWSRLPREERVCRCTADVLQDECKDLTRTPGVAR
jgi:hypothetical protein